MVAGPPRVLCRWRLTALSLTGFWNAPSSRQHRRAGSGFQRLPTEASKALCSVMVSLSWRMRAASASLPAHSRTEA